MDNIKFEGISKDEKIVFFIRKHWSVFSGIILTYSILFIVPMTIYILAKINNLTEQIPIGFRAVVLMAVSMCYLICAISFLVTWMDHHLDVLIITNLRIINVKQIGLWKRVVSEQRLDRVQDVTSDVHGIKQSLLNFGDISIQTAGEAERFHFEDIPNPEQTAQEIMGLLKNFEEVKEYEQENRNTLQSKIRQQ